MADPEYDLKTLCERAKVTPRTVHFYVQQGLLPPAGAPGPGARYGRGHESRLELIRLLQKQHLPLAEIAKRMKRLTDDQVEELLAETKERPHDKGGTALDYIRNVLEDKSSAYFSPSPASAPSQSPPSARLSWRSVNPLSEPSTPSRSQWERFTLAEGIELHVQRPLERLQQKKLERLLAAAREMFQED